MSGMKVKDISECKRNGTPVVITRYDPNDGCYTAERAIVIGREADTGHWRIQMEDGAVRTVAMIDCTWAEHQQKEDQSKAAERLNDMFIALGWASDDPDDCNDDKAWANTNYHRRDIIDLTLDNRTALRLIDIIKAGIEHQQEVTQ